MSPTFHWAKVRAFSNATEDPETVKGLLLSLSGAEGVSIEETEGHHGNPILIMEAALKNSGKINRMYRSLGTDLLEAVSEEIDDRLDDDLIFYIRLDKQQLALGNIVLSKGGDSVFVHGKVVAHPARKEIALANLGAFLEKVTRPRARSSVSP